MTEKLDAIEKQIIAQQKSYTEDYETKKSEIGKHKEMINSKLSKIEEDIAKVLVFDLSFHNSLTRRRVWQRKSKISMKQSQL